MPYTKEQWRPVLSIAIRDLMEAMSLIDAVERDGGAKLAPIGLNPDIVDYQIDMNVAQKTALRQKFLSEIDGVIAALTTARNA